MIAIAPPDQAADGIRALGCRFVPLEIDSKSRSPFHDLRLLLRYRKILRRERPDIFLGFTIKPNLYGSLAAQGRGIPVINNISGLGTAFIGGGVLSRLVARLYRAALRRSHLVFFQNPEDRDLFVSRRLVAAERTALLPGSGIDLSRFTPPASAIENKDRFTFLMTGRILADKGVREYAEAARIVGRTLPNVRCQLLGFLNSDNRTAIDRAVVTGWEESAGLEYLGDTDDVRPYIAAADCLVLPSYREGLPRSLLEGAAMAKPLIATDVPGCRDVVEHGANGYLCAVRDGAALAEAMIRMAGLAADDRLAMGRHGRRKVEADYDEALVIARYLDAIAAATGAAIQR